MDIYSTAQLNRLVQSLIRPQTGLLTAFFPLVETSDVEEIKFDVQKGKRRISPFVSPLKEGKIIESLGYVTNTFSPAYVKDKRQHDPNKAMKRSAGEIIGGNLAPVDRRMANLIRDTRDQLDMLTRRKEVMASEAIRTGKVTVSGDGYDTVVVDFGRKASHTITLAVGSKWTDAGVNALEDLEDWALLVQQDCGAVVTDVIMDVDAWRAFRDNVGPQTLRDLFRAAPDAAQQLRYTTLGQTGLHLQGVIGQFAFYTYSDWYVDDNDVEQPILPSGTVILGSADVEGVQHHGAIRDEDAGMQPLEYFSKSWVVPDPSVRYLLMQAAPLVVPYRPNASLCATVL